MGIKVVLEIVGMMLTEVELSVLVAIPIDEALIKLSVLSVDEGVPVVPSVPYEEPIVVQLDNPVLANPLEVVMPIFSVMWSVPVIVVRVVPVFVENFSAVVPCSVVFEATEKVETIEL